MEKTHCKDCQFISKAASVLNAEELNILESKCSQVEFNKGEILFKQNTFSTNIIFLKTGLVKLHMASVKRDQIVQISKAPAFLGIPTTFADNINQYSATAIKNSIACFIDITVFKGFIFKNGEFAYEIIINLCKSELDNVRRCVNRSQKQTTGRVADALLYFSQQIFNDDEFDFPLTRSDLADLICSSRESVSRVLWDLNNDDIIEMNGRNIKIIDKTLLEHIGKYG